MSRNASSAKALAQQRKSRRKWLTFLRIFKYGVSNFSRNAWLTVAATAVMTITLLIIFITFVAQNVLADTATEVGKRIPRSIYLTPETTAKQAQPIIDEIKKIKNVEDATFISSAEARADYALQNKQNNNTLDAISEATNRLPATIRISLKDVNDTNELVVLVDKNSTLEKYIDPLRKPTFIGERKKATSTIASWTAFAQKVGIVASVVFVSISSLIIFNTIRMAIFNRREEIQMMKLIGADKSFIRGPFVVEAVVYGLIAAFIATALGFVFMIASVDKLQSYGVTIAPTADAMISYAPLVLLAMIGVGALIGIISSLLATRRYLKI
jgi:cell division transport system permease protein